MPTHYLLYALVLVVALVSCARSDESLPVPVRVSEVKDGADFPLEPSETQPLLEHEPLPCTKIHNHSAGESSTKEKRLTWGYTTRGSFAIQYRLETSATIRNANLNRMQMISDLGIGRFADSYWASFSPNPKVWMYHDQADGVANEGQPGGGGPFYGFMSIAYDLNPSVTPMSTRYHSEPLVWLHEIAHHAAYHYQGTYHFMSTEYNNAMSLQLYGGGNCIRLGYGTNAWFGDNYYLSSTCYASSNAGEYMAELTEAYFGVNDFFPFNNRQLKRHDPVGWAAIGNWWQNPNLSMRARLATTSASVYFYNNCPFAVDIFWVDYNGAEVQFNSLGTGQSYTQGSFETHPWVVRHQNVAQGGAASAPIRYEVQIVMTRNFNINVKTCDRRDYPGCTDSNANCPSWASGGECARNPSWMLFNCRKSCNTCFYKDSYINSLISSPYSV